ncbi:MULTISPECIES: efflux RND transporter periplasmic adaptor subunit [Bradyrhizobium]|nr:MULTISPECIES: efflux RND transporter periplasmic adaptor subunit [Bradyrhizobium]MCG2628230.1 efflux RND transporter periplasmic adaptor subunit [Bradyrhizobium zhengyangense]MCG2643349.1 efflux RND transporter periplasmic adaptor subunit [Bradyrhizobium zhengyangense]MCG2670337.1 efflux RND transporter periplasmic adaptor subunit [Bradyrhizobium zhengyangense]
MGRMSSRDVNVGDLVAKGQRLGSLDSTVAQLAIVSSQADLANARAVLANAEATLERKHKLFSTGSGTQADLDAATAAQQSAQSRATQAEASLQKATEQLGYTTLNSSYDGVVVSWSTEIGQVVSVGQTVVTIARPTFRDGVFDIPDDRIGQFIEGSSSRASLLVQDSIAAKAVVREIAPQSDSSTRTRRIRFTIEDPPEAFRLGTTIRLAAAQEGQMEIPVSALLKIEGQDAVWIVGANKRALARPVMLGAHRGDRVAVTSGLSIGDRVITAGVHSLSEGQLVKLLQENQS